MNISEFVANLFFLYGLFLMPKNSFFSFLKLGGTDSRRGRKDNLPFVEFGSKLEGFIMLMPVGGCSDR